MGKLWGSKERGSIRKKMNVGKTWERVQEYVGIVGKGYVGRWKEIGQ
jgi:hypothetical protein